MPQHKYVIKYSMCRCEILGKCESYGMPSSHTQVVAYVLGIYIAFRLKSKGSPQKFITVIHAAESIALAALTLVVGYARVHLGYHTAFQTFIGGSFGLVFGLLWGWLAVDVVEKHARGFLEQWPILRALGCTCGYDDSLSEHVKRK